MLIILALAMVGMTQGQCPHDLGLQAPCGIPKSTS